MTMINGLVGSASGDNVGNWPDFTATKYQQRLKKLLCSLNVCLSRPYFHQRSYIPSPTYSIGIGVV
jgi:hypothetical protein